jgi:hypothetical protein
LVTVMLFSAIRSTPQIRRQKMPARCGGQRTGHRIPSDAVLLDQTAIR